MLKPTQDKELKLEITAIMWNFHNNVRISESAFKWTDQILRLLENRGYHVGLPSSIEQALNSGDGVYRP